MRVRQVSTEDVEAWDGFVRSRADASPFHQHGWGQAILSAYGHAPLNLMAQAETGEVLGVLPICRFRVPTRAEKWVSLPFCDLGGPVASTQEAGQALLEETRRLAGESGVQSAQFRNAVPDARPHGAVPVAVDKVRMILSLPGSSEALLASFKSKLRSQVNKAAKNGMEFGWVGPDGVDDFYSIFSRNMRDLGSPVHSRGLFVEILRNLPESAKIGVVRADGLPVAAGLVLGLGRHRLSIPWASSLRSHNHLAPNMWLYWNLLKHAADEGFAEFDFGRSTKGEGTYRFKAQWGSEPQPLGWSDVQWSGTAAAPTTRQESSEPGKVRSLVESVWKKLPLPVANRVGPVFRKYIDL